MTSESFERAVETRASVLVVDDDPDIRETARLLLEPHRFEVDTASDGPMGLKAARSRAYDVVVLDINMPGVDGIKLGHVLRADPKTASSQIIVQTSLSESWVRQRFAGYDAFVSKPPTTINLVQAVLRLLHHEVELGQSGK